MDIVVRIEGKSPKGKAAAKMLAPEVARAVFDLGIVEVTLAGGLEWPQSGSDLERVSRLGDLRDLAGLGLDVLVTKGRR